MLGWITDKGSYLGIETEARAAILHNILYSLLDKRMSEFQEKRHSRDKGGGENCSRKGTVHGKMASYTFVIKVMEGHAGQSL